MASRCAPHAWLANFDRADKLHAMKHRSCRRCCSCCDLQVMSTLGLQKAGPELGKIMAAAMEWQLVHPKGTLAECQEHVRAWWQAHQASGAGK